MAERRSTRTKRKRDDDELAEETDDELAEETEDEPGDELADETDDTDDTDDELADELDDEPDEEDAGQAGRGHDGGARRRAGRGGKGGLRAATAGQAAMSQIAELTGKEPEGVTGVEPSDDGWLVGVEVVEDRRIPSSTDILATYETEIDMDGNLVAYRRLKRYPRGRGDQEDS
jgi:hypothetical protein